MQLKISLFYLIKTIMRLCDGQSLSAAQKTALPHEETHFARGGTGPLSQITLKLIERGWRGKRSPDSSHLAPCGGSVSRRLFILYLISQDSMQITYLWWTRTQVQTESGSSILSRLIKQYYYTNYFQCLNKGLPIAYNYIYYN